jgi:hypothetical protein
VLRELRPPDVLQLCELLADLNLAWIWSVGWDRPLYNSPVRLSGDRGRVETWPTIPWALWGNRPLDCKGAAAWRVAELRARGEPASFSVHGAVDRRRHLAYHVNVIRGSGDTEDPQRVIGG